MRTLSLLLVLAAAASAQGGSAAALKKKLAKPFTKNVVWVQDFDEARRLSKKLNKPIFAYFTRTFAPDAGSEQVEDGVFASKEFQAFSKDYVMLLSIATGLRGRKDDTLWARFGIRAFPWVAFLDADGGAIVSHRGAPTVAAFQETAKPAREHFVLREKALAGDRTARFQYLLWRASRAQLSTRAFRNELATVGKLTEEEQAAAKRATTKLLLEEAKQYAEPMWFARMEKAGHVPEDFSERANFYLGAMIWAEYNEDLPEMERLFGIIKKMLAGEAGAQAIFNKIRARHAALKAELQMRERARDAAAPK